MAEKRLIDANGIVAVAERAYDQWNLAMAAADGKREINLVYKRQELCKAVKAVAENCPTVDAVEVVRCKDCKHSTLPSVVTQRYGRPGTLTCNNHNSPCNRRNVNVNDFCSYGEAEK